MTQETKPTTDLREALEQASRKLAAALHNITELKIETRWVTLNQNVMNESDSRLVAQTKIQLDGDTTVIIPMKNEDGALVPDTVLLEMHKEAVASAMEYRQNLIDLITDFVENRTR